MAEDVGQAYVGIVPSLKGFSANLRRQLAAEIGGVIAPIEKAGGQAGRSFGDRMREGIRSRLSGIAQMLKTGLVVGAAAAVAGLGALTAFGLKSAAAMEQTAIGIEALIGNAKDAKTFLGELQQFAAKTPFEFSGVADASKRILAFGQAVGITRDEVIPTLAVVGDLVSVLGGGQESIDSVLRAFGQISSKGRVQQEEILQLAEALPGFNANAAIAAALGVPVAESMRLITAGEVDAQTAIEALLQGMREFPGAAGAMEKQAGTLLGVFSTFKDTVGIALTNAFQPAIPAIKDALTELTPVIGTALDQLAPALGGALSAALPLLGQLVQGLTPILTPIVDTVAGALASLGESGALAALGDAFGALLAPLVPLGPVLGEIAGALAGALAPIIASLVPLAEALGPALVQLVTPLVPIIVRVADTLGALLAPAFEFLGEIIREVSPFLSVLIRTIGALLAPILKALAPIVDVVLDALKPLLPTLGDLLIPVLALATAFTPLVELLAELLLVLMPIITPLLQLTAAWINFLAQKAVVPLVEKITQALALLLAPINGLIGPVKSLGDGFAAIDWSVIPTQMADAFKAVVEGIGRFLSDLRTKLGEIHARVVGAFIGAATWLWEGGRDIVRGLINGIGSMAGALRDKLFGIVKSAWSSAKNFLGISSPSKLFAELGENTVAGYIEGIEGQARNLSASMTGIVAPAAASTPRVAPAPAAVPVRLESDDPLWAMFLERQQAAIRRLFGGDVNLALSATF